MSKRVVFTFDDRSFNALEQIKQNGSFASLGVAVRESIGITKVLQAQAIEGFTEIYVRNPRTDQEKTICVPSLLNTPRSD